jgi:hypothetical protein
MLHKHGKQLSLKWSTIRVTNIYHWEIPLFAVYPNEADAGKESRLCSGLEGGEALRVSLVETELHMDLLFTPKNLKPMQLWRDIVGRVRTTADAEVFRRSV